MYLVYLENSLVLYIDAINVIINVHTQKTMKRDSKLITSTTENPDS